MILHSNPGTNHQMVNSFQDEKLEIKVNMWPTHKLLLLMEVVFFCHFIITNHVLEQKLKLFYSVFQIRQYGFL